MGGLDPTQLDRYSRQIVMDEVGPEGQQALLDASVLVVGAGGLGAPVLQYLAAAGVGTLGVVDHDVVERSNLQRQVIHGDADVGRPKVDSAADFVADLNPDVAVETHETRFSSENAPGFVDEYDMVVDASDNFPTRYLVSDACTLAGVPASHGAVYRFEGQITTFAGDGPCYRCLFPSAPPEGTIPNCATVGVLGSVPGTIGSLQATEVLKHVVGTGESLAGRLLVFDAGRMTVDEVPIEPNPDCPLCGEDPVIGSVGDATYEGDCSLPT
jgi:adenylyltransferase/sulfurtransferase